MFDVIANGVCPSLQQVTMETTNNILFILMHQCHTDIIPIILSNLVMHLTNKVETVMAKYITQ